MIQISALGKYRLPEKQLNFTMLPSDRPGIEEEKRKTKYPVTIGCDVEPVGFFVLDSGTDKYDYTQNPNAFLLRSLSVNSKYQGMGIGKKAMEDLLTDYSKELNQWCDEIVFGVNEGNVEVYNLYLKCGFIDTGRKYLGGRNGPKIIMSKNI